MFPAAWISYREKKGSNLALKGQRARWYKWNKLKDVPNAEDLAKERWDKVCKIRSRTVINKLNSITHGELVRFEPPAAATTAVGESSLSAANVIHSKLLTQVLLNYNGNKRGLSNTHQHMGVDSDKGLCLSPEETLYLMMIGHFRALSTNKIQISGQHFLVMASMYHQFRTYIKLARSSIRLVNHQPHIAVTSYEKSIKLHQHLATDGKRNKKVQNALAIVSKSGSDSAFELHSENPSTSECTMDDEMAAFYSIISKDLATDSCDTKAEEEEQQSEKTRVDDKEYDMKKREILTDLNSMDPCTGIYYLSACKNYLPKSIKVLDRDYIISEKSILDSYRFKARFAAKGELRHEVLDSDIESSSCSDSDSVASLSDYDSPSDSEDASHYGWYGDWNNKVYMKRVMLDVEEQKKGVKREFDEEETDFKPPDKIFKKDVDLRLEKIEWNDNPSSFGIHNSNGNGDMNGGFTSEFETSSSHRPDVNDSMDSHANHSEELQITKSDNTDQEMDITENCMKFIADMRNKTDSMPIIPESEKSLEETQPSDVKHQAFMFLDKLKEEWQDVDMGKDTISTKSDHMMSSNKHNKHSNELSTSKETKYNLAKNSKNLSKNSLDRMISSGPKGSLTVSFSVGKGSDSKENPSVYSRLDGNDGEFSSMEDDDLRNFLQNSSRLNAKFRGNGHINNINMQSNHRRNQYLNSGFLNGRCHDKQVKCEMEGRMRKDRVEQMFYKIDNIPKHHSSNGTREFNGSASNGHKTVNAGVNNGIREANAGVNNGIREVNAGVNSGIREANAGVKNGIRANNAGVNNGIREANAGVNNGIRANNAGVNNGIRTANAGVHNGIRTINTDGIGSKASTSAKNRKVPNKGSLNQQARRLKFAEDKKYKSGESVMHLDIAYQAQSWGEYKRLLERRKAQAAKRVSNDILYSGVNTPLVTGCAVSVGSLYGGGSSNEMLNQWLKNSAAQSSESREITKRASKHFVSNPLSSQRKSEELATSDDSWLLPSISYDLYPHNSGFARSKPTIPHSRILIPSCKEFDVCNHLLLRSHFADSARLAIATNAEHCTGRLKFQSFLPTEGEKFTAKNTVWWGKKK